MRSLIGGKIKEGLIVQNWPDILRAVATMAAGVIPPSQLLGKFSPYPRQHDLAFALREIGRIERTLFIIEWLLDADMQRRAQIGLNKGEVHHALKNALRIGRQGEIRDRTAEGQHYRMAGRTSSSPASIGALADEACHHRALFADWWYVWMVGDDVDQNKGGGQSGVFRVFRGPHFFVKDDCSNKDLSAIIPVNVQE